MKTKIPYRAFNKYVLRSPVLSLNFIRKILASSQIELELKKAFADNAIREAVYLASPALFIELSKWENDDIKSDKIERLNIALLKYLTRMSFRCTPFGLFAGCSTGSFSDESVIQISEFSEHDRYTRLDMNYLSQVSEGLLKNQSIRHGVKYYKNNSLYPIGDELRYIESYYSPGSRTRKHKIVEIDNNEYLRKVLINAIDGASIEELVEKITDPKISKDQAIDFLHKLIEFQILLPQISPSVTGEEFGDRMLNILKKNIPDNPVVQKLDSLNKQIVKLDHKIGNNIGTYENIVDYCENIGIESNAKYLFQTDLNVKTETNTLDKKIIESVSKGLVFLNKVTSLSYIERLNAFKEAFFKRYGTEAIPLPIALDKEIGIAYNSSANIDSSPIIDDLDIPRKKSKIHVKEKAFTEAQLHLRNLVLKAIVDSKKVIQIQEEDFQGFEENWEDLPLTMSSVTQIIIENDEVKIKMNSAGNSSAANLLARFCYGNSDIHNHVKQIIETEKRLEKDKVFAEIAHIPESRVGNILSRPNLRDFEIPYLSNPGLDKQHTININDLFVRISSDKRIVLETKDKTEIIPRLSNAHNFWTNSLPIYNFLSDLQFQNQRSRLFLDMDIFGKTFEFIPRIEYSNLILNEATWNLNSTFFKELNNEPNDTALTEKCSNLRSEKNIPEKAILVDGDKTLLIDFERPLSIKMFLHEIKSKSWITLKEFLFDNNEGVVKNKQGELYSNQIIVSFYKSKEQ